MTLHTVQLKVPFCSPRANTNEVSLPCSVSASWHLSSCNSKLTLSEVASKGRIATIISLVIELRVPNIPGALS